MKKCPACQEMAQDQATKCPHCGSEFPSLGKAIFQLLFWGSLFLVALIFLGIPALVGLIAMIETIFSK